MGIAVVILAPLLFIVVAVWAVVQLTVFIFWLCFAPVIWLANRPPKPPKRYDVQVRHYD
jgi:type IV secretory pathway TrbD component